MVGLRVGRVIHIVAVAAVVSTVLIGCGGGGGGSSVNSEDSRASVAVNSSRSVKLNNYNNWQSATDDPKDAGRRVELLARRDSLCFTEGWDRHGITPKVIKSINPSCKVYRLYNLVVKCAWDSDWSDPNNTSLMQTPLTKAEIDANDWWLRDGNGNIVKETSNKVWYLDVGKPGFKEAYLKAILDRNAGKGFNGIVFDVWNYSITTNYFGISGGWFHKNPMPKQYPTDAAWFSNAWQPFVNYVSSGLRRTGLRVIGNCAGEYLNNDPRTVWQRSQVDGTVYEQWVVGWNGEWLSGSTIERRIEAMKSDPLEVWTADYGLRGTDKDYARKQVMGLAMYYIAMPASQMNRSYHHVRNEKVYWEPIWDFNIGTPAAQATKLAGKYFWSRKFRSGLVLLNYESSGSVSYTLDRAYRDVTGKTVSGRVVVPYRSAMILATK